jgi:hypothetical protein
MMPAAGFILLVDPLMGDIAARAAASPARDTPETVYLVPDEAYSRVTTRGPGSNNGDHSDMSAAPARHACPVAGKGGGKGRSVHSASGLMPEHGQSSRREWALFIMWWLVVVAAMGGLAAYEAVRVAEARATTVGS